MSLVKVYEAAYLRLQANRVRRLRDEAAARGERFVDLSHAIRLECGFEVRLNIGDDGKAAVLFKRADEPDRVREQIAASEILRTEAKCEEEHDKMARYV